MTKDEIEALKASYPLWRKAAEEVLEKEHNLPNKEELERPHTDAMFANRAAFSGGVLHGLNALFSKAKVTTKKLAPRTRHLIPENPI